MTQARVLALPAALWLAACSFTVKNDLVASHPDDVEAFALKAAETFYRRDSDALAAMAGENPTFKASEVDLMCEFLNDSADLSRITAIDRATETVNGKTSYVTIYAIPRDKGREVVETVIRKAEDGTCCVVYGSRFDVQLGEEYEMGS